MTAQSQDIIRFYGVLYEKIGRSIAEKSFTIPANPLAPNAISARNSIDFNPSDKRSVIAIVGFTIYCEDANGALIKVALDTPKSQVYTVNLGSTTLTFDHEYGPYTLSQNKVYDLTPNLQKLPALIFPNEKASLWAETKVNAAVDVSWIADILFLRKIPER